MSALKLLLLAVILAGAVILILHTQRSRILRVGESAPDFTLPTLTGESLSLGDYRGRVVVLNFWATWCPPCVEETPSLEKFSEEMRTRGVRVVGVSVDQDRQALEEFVSKFRLSFLVARDPNRAVASRYGTFKFPESYIIDRDGKIAEKLVGGVNWQDPRVLEFIQGLAR